MLSVLFIIAFVGMGMAELAVTQNVVAFRTYNKAAGLINAERFGVLLEKEIHQTTGFTPNCTQQHLEFTIPFDSTTDVINSISSPSNFLTYKYDVLRDPADSKGEKYLIQRTAGGNVSTVLKNLVGPKSADGNIAVFSYIVNTNGLNPNYQPIYKGGIPVTSMIPFQPKGSLTQIHAVAINLELANDTESIRRDTQPVNTCLHQEFYARNNLQHP